MTKERTALGKKINSMFLSENFQLAREALTYILESVGPLQLANKALEKAKICSPKPWIITAEFLKDIKISVPSFTPNTPEEEMARIILNRLEDGESLHSIFQELTKALEHDSIYVRNLLERLWRKGILPLHDYEAHYFIFFLTDKKLQELYS